MYLIYVHLSMLPGHTSLPPDQPDHLKVKKGAQLLHFLSDLVETWCGDSKSKPLIEEYQKNDSFKPLEFLVVAILRS